MTRLERLQRKMDKTVHLQGLGDFKGREVGLVKAGDVLVYNYGHTATVVDSALVGKKSISLTVRTNSGDTYRHTYRAWALVVVQ